MVKSRNRHTTFHYNDSKICQKTFLFLHGVGYWRFKAIKASYLVNGPCSRRRGNKGRSTKLELSLKEIEEVVQFIMDYAGTYECFSPGVFLWACSYKLGKEVSENYTSYMGMYEHKHTLFIPLLELAIFYLN